jgi:hypothetical protein
MSLESESEYQPQSDPAYPTHYQAEYQAPAAPVYSSFGPVCILLIALILWSGYQMALTYAQASELSAEIKAAQPEITAAQNLRSRLYSLAQDLIETSAKDPYAAQIVKEANIQVKPNPNAAPSH